MAYDPTKVAFAWGPVPAKGFQDGEMINWTFDNDEWSAYEGTRGEGSMVYSPNRTGTCTVTLQADSPTNAAWSALYEAKTPLPITVTDRSSTKAVAFAKEAMPSKQPDTVRAREKPVVTWVFKFVGGKAEHIGEVF